MLHELKTWPEFFQMVCEGVKTFEVRRDDRTPPYAVGDVLRLREFFPESGEYAGPSVDALVVLAFRGDPLPDGWCAMQIVRCGAVDYMGGKA